MDLELAEVCLLSWSADQQITRVEGASQAVLDGTPKGLIGRSLAEALGTHPERAAALDRRARQAQGPAVEFVSSSSRAAPRWLRVRSLLQKEQVVAAVIDLSSALSGAPPIQLGGLSSSLSHEIRNPLSSIKLAVQTLALNQGLSDKDRRRLSLANKEIRTMERQLWLFSEYGRASEPSLELVPLKGLVQEASALIEPELTEREAKVIPLDPDQVKGKADPARLRPVLAQFLLNVAIGRPVGANVEVRLSQADHRSGLWVEDQGLAPTAEDLPNLFVPFGSSLARGAGLSLAALRRVMLSFGGEVRVGPGPQGGTLFTLEFQA